MSGFVNPTTPNLADYTTFVQTEMAIPTSALPADSPWLGYAFNQGMAMTLYVPCVTAIEYVLAVYNCAGHIQLEITPDQAGQTYFANAVGPQGYNLSGFTTGILQSSADQGTSNSMVVPDSLHSLTIRDLQFSKTPWGRYWIGYGQDFGPLWGVT